MQYRVPQRYHVLWPRVLHPTADIRTNTGTDDARADTDTDTRVDAADIRANTGTDDARADTDTDTRADAANSIFVRCEQLSSRNLRRPRSHVHVTEDVLLQLWHHVYAVRCQPVRRV